MIVSDYIKTHKLHKDIFIAIYNAEHKWIICGLQDDPRLADYMNLTVTDSSTASEQIVRLYTNYSDAMQIGYYRMKADQADSAVESSSSDNSTSRSKQRRSSQRKKTK